MNKIISIIFLTLLFAANAHARNVQTYKVSITNATTHHVFTPTLIATHTKNINLFQIGTAASDGLITQAETGDPSVLLSETQARTGVFDTVIGSFIPYGQEASFTITARKHARLSLTAMLATTNDGFVGLNNVALPKNSVTYFAYTYDAGSESNNEDCAFIPGPPCSEESGNARTESGEGFISIHNGIHGIADLNTQDLDWRGPVAIVTITKISN